MRRYEPPEMKGYFQEGYEVMHIVMGYSAYLMNIPGKYLAWSFSESSMPLLFFDVLMILLWNIKLDLSFIAPCFLVECRSPPLFLKSRVISEYYVCRKSQVANELWFLIKGTAFHRLLLSTVHCKEVACCNAFSVD